MNNKFGPFVGAFATGLNGAVVHIDKPPHERQSNAESTVRPFQRPINLREHVEDAGQQIGWDANAVISDAIDGIASFPFGGEPNVPASLCVLGGVVQQVQKNLSEPDGIGVQVDRLCGEAEREFVTAFLDECAAEGKTTDKVTVEAMLEDLTGKTMPEFP